MRNVMIGAALCLAVISMACSGGVTVNQEFEPDTEFWRYKTWDWNPDSETTQMVAASSSAFVKEYDEYVRDIVAAQMKDKGLTRVETNPDILIGYKVGMRSAAGKTDWDLDYQEQMKNADVYKTYGGVVVFDFVDARTGRQMWYGTGTGSVNIDPTPQMAKDEIRNAVTKILNQYPPK